MIGSGSCSLGSIVGMPEYALEVTAPQGLKIFDNLNKQSGCMRSEKVNSLIAQVLLSKIKTRHASVSDQLQISFPGINILTETHPNGALWKKMGYPF